MSRNRFQLLLSFMHFSYNNSILPGDRLGKIQPLMDMLQMRYQRLNVQGENIVIDETLIPWRGRLSFRKYIANKANPYGIKHFKLCSTEGYLVSKNTFWQVINWEFGLAKNICEDISAKLKGEGRTLYVDNFYTSYELARSMINQKTHVVSILLVIKKYFRKELMGAPIKKGEVVAREKSNGIVVLKWKDKRDIRMLSTKHAPVMVSTLNEQINPDEPSTNRRSRSTRRATEKPLAVFEYNKGKSGIGSV
ncbi:PREDICTED: piggyBac transposable element-derived protein 2-like [Rhagoletis zephyria]|uniref:piggyBac transposable element-derived protein 2-like n=1 Tax=Rhagoletis zephyria TaxID=28612 RepID=UPI0008115BC0|nr:PREDICTED: piggyBac transposable element-derived protein 2-like [Rhagoletis zephyria]